MVPGVTNTVQQKMLQRVRDMERRLQTLESQESVSFADASGDYDNLPARLDGIDKLPGAWRLSADVSAGASSAALRTVSDGAVQNIGEWVIVDAYTIEAELCFIDVSGAAVPVDGGTFDHAHSTDDIAIPIRSKELNLRFFGAVGNGVNDDRAAMQATVDECPAGGAVAGNPGDVYRLSDKVTLKSDIKFNMRGAVIKPDNTADGFLIHSNGSLGSEVTDVTVKNVFINCANAPASGAFGRIRFDHCRDIVVHDCYQFNAGDGFVEIKNTERFDIRGLRCKDGGQGVLTFLGGCKDGTVSDLFGYECEEILDFFNDDNIELTNIIGYRSTTVASEAIDLSSSRNITFDNVTLVGGWREGILVKTEGAIAWGNITLKGLQFDGFTNYGIRAVVFTTEPATSPTGLHVSNSRLSSTVAGSIGVNVGGGAIGIDEVSVPDCQIHVDGQSIELVGVKKASVRDNPRLHSVNNIAVEARVGSLSPAEYTVEVINNTLEAPVNIAVSVTDAIRPIIRGNAIKDAAGLAALFVKNCKQPTVKSNNIDNVAERGIYVQYTSTTYLDTINNIIGATIDDNVIVNWGADTTFRAAIYLQLQLGAGETGTYNVASLCNNRMWIDDDGTANSQFGLQFAIDSLTSIDYIKADDNLIFNVPSANIQNVAALGANSTTNNNVEN